MRSTAVGRGAVNGPELLLGYQRPVLRGRLCPGEKRGSALTEVALSLAGGLEVRRVTLAVHGMACIACAMHIQNKLNNIDGVRASVDYSTKLAAIDIDAGISVDELCDAVRAIGYDAEPHGDSVVYNSEIHDRLQTGSWRQLFAWVIRWLTFGAW